VLVAGIAIAVVAMRDPGPAAVPGCDRQGVPPSWNKDRRALVLARVAPPAAKIALAKEIETVVGEYAVAWEKLASETCVAAGRKQISESTEAAATSCLARRSATLEYLVEHADLDPPTLARIVEALEPIETCRGSTTPRPSSGEHNRLLGAIDLAAVLVQAAPAAAPDLAQLVADASAAGDVAAVAEASYLEGSVAFARGRDAEPALRRAIEHAEKAGDDRIRTRATALLAAAAARAGRIADATMHRDLAVSAAARTVDATTAVAVERAKIAVALASGDGAAELAGWRRIEAIQIERFGDPSLGLADTRFAIAAVMQRIANPDAAAMFDRARSTLAAVVDEQPLQTLERAATEERLPARRVVLAERIVEIVRRENPAGLPLALETLAYDYELLGDYARSLAVTIEALAVVGDDEAMRVELLESAALMAFEVADQADDKALRARRLDDALGFLDRMPPAARDGDSVRAIRGRTLLLQGHHLDAVPHLTEALAAAERAKPPNPIRISIRAFALARALWEGGARDRARALAEKAAARIPDARAMFESARVSYGAPIDRLERHAAAVDAWLKAHR
jgi:tetratricopeptide (TPR) repeat protein